MPGGRGRGLRQNQSVAGLFNDPAVVAKQGGNPWDAYEQWAKPGAGNEDLRNYLTSTNYWGYGGWTPTNYRMGDPRLRATKGWDVDKNIYQKGTPEYGVLSNFTDPSNTLMNPATPREPGQLIGALADRLPYVMKQDYLKQTGQEFTGEFSLLDKLRFMEQNNMRQKRGMLSGGYRDGGRPTGGGGGLGGQEGGGKGGDENIMWAPSVRPPVGPASVGSRPQYTAPLSAGSQDRQQRYTQSRGPSRALGPRSPRRQSGRSLSELFNPFGR